MRPRKIPPIVNISESLNVNVDVNALANSKTRKELKTYNNINKTAIKITRFHVKSSIERLGTSRTKTAVKVIYAINVQKNKSRTPILILFFINFM